MHKIYWHTSISYCIDRCSDSCCKYVTVCYRRQLSTFVYARLSNSYDYVIVVRPIDIKSAAAAAAAAGNIETVAVCQLLDSHSGIADNLLCN